MSNKYIGWMRFGWTHWEPLVTGDCAKRVWEELRNWLSEDLDGERLVLPADEKPILTQPMQEFQ